MEDRERALKSARWTDQATSDLEKIEDFIAQDNAAAARRVIANIMARVEILLAFPESGRRVPETPEDTQREIPYDNYRIVYRVTVNEVIVLQVFERHRSFGRGRFPRT